MGRAPTITRLRLACVGTVLASALVAALDVACGSFRADETAPVDDAAADALAPLDGGGVDGSRVPEAAPPSGDYRSAILKEGPLAYWRMSTVSNGSIPDETGGGNDLVLQGPPGSVVVGVPGALLGDSDTATRFDGHTGYAIATQPRAFDFVDGGSFTIELWAKRADGDAGTFQHLVSSIEGSQNNRSGYLLYALVGDTSSSPRTEFERDSYPSDGGDRNTHGALAAVDHWAHYAAVFDANDHSIVVYVDGVGSPGASVIGSLVPTTAKFAVGGNGSGVGTFPGWIDEVAVYAKALSAKQVATHRSLGRPP